MTVRLATPRDIPVLARQRIGMFRDLRPVTDRECATIEEATRAFLRRAIPAVEFVGFLVEEKGVPVAGGGLLVRRMMPRPGHPRGFLEAHVLNVFTGEPHRRRGHARALMRAILRWCRANGFQRLTLHASEKGRPLYESLGFRTVAEMRLDLTPSRRRAASRPRR